jgi:hypothetical protein
MSDDRRAGLSLPLHVSDLRGLARLGFDATLGLTDVVEQMHHTIVARAAPLGPPRTGRTQGLTGLVYRSVRGVTRLWGRGVDAAVGAAATLAPPAAVSPRREAWLAALQGVWGDHLEASGNPLATPMALRVDGRTLDLSAEGLRAALPEATGRIAVLLHGLCMNDLQWRRQGHHHGEMLAREAGYTVLALRYNSGLHISDNGRRLSALLDELIAHWPVPVTELVLVGHSMGGLVARSACHAGARKPWRRHLTRLVCLGAPHHGAMLERGGHLVDRALEWSPYVAPFARLGKARSAGITDLRWGNLQDADWQAREGQDRRHAQRHDDRVPTPLPRGVAVYCLAATTAEQPRGMRHALLGDGLVSLASAWGEHRDPALALKLPASHRALITQANHWDLLSHPDAAAALRRWLA